MTKGLVLRRAALHVRVLPWRVRQRRMKVSTLREHASDVLEFADDLGTFIFGVVTWLLILVAAPALVVVLAVFLLPVELLVAVIIALVVLIIRFAGVTPWTVVVLEEDGSETFERYRSLVRAARRVRALNGSRRIAVQLSWG